jgi:CheY-like chemotaxis protein
MAHALDARPILIVEDSEEDFDTVKTAFEEARIPNELRRATTAEACLKLLKSDGPAPLRPAFVLMDLNLPGWDGREVIQMLKADPKLRALPVVVLTTSSSPKDLDLSYQSGASAYHVKPVRHADHLQLLNDIVRYWLGSVVYPDDEGKLT